jgi:putative addiction module component (TIGR02574 family)
MMQQSLIEHEIEALTVAQKLELIGRLWDSIPAAEESLPVPEWHRRELEQRLKDADDTPELSVPWKRDHLSHEA